MLFVLLSYRPAEPNALSLMEMTHAAGLRLEANVYALGRRLEAEVNTIKY
jgi:hypothetical protein